LAEAVRRGSVEAAFGAGGGGGACAHEEWALERLSETATALLSRLEAHDDPFGRFAAWKDGDYEDDEDDEGDEDEFDEDGEDGEEDDDGEDEVDRAAGQAAAPVSHAEGFVSAPAFNFVCPSGPSQGLKVPFHNRSWKFILAQIPLRFGFE
jgi:hypothetical protein